MLRWLPIAIGLVGCTPATTHGLRTDGVLLGRGHAEGVAFVGGGAPLGQGSGIVGGGVGLALPLSDRLDLAPSAGWGGDRLGADLEARWALLDEGPLAVTALFGAGVVGPDPLVVGVHAGAVVSRRFGEATRLFLGARANPSISLGDGDDLLWLHSAMGASFRPAGTGLRVQPEVFWELPLGDTDSAGFGAMLTLGARGRVRPAAGSQPD